MRRFVLFCTVALATALSGCGRGPVAGAAHVPPPAKQVSAGSLNLVFTIPARTPSAGHTAPRYLSPATQSIAITLTPAGGGSPIVKHAALTSSSAGCTSTLVSTVCTIAIAIPPDSYAGQFVTYDGPLDGSGDPTGAILSANQAVPITVTAGAQNAILFVLGGIPVGVAFIPNAASALSGSQSTGYTLKSCADQTVTVLGVDADGNYIIGPGSPTPSLTSTDAHFTIAGPTAAAPNAFMIHEKNAPSSGVTVLFGPKATPAADSGGSAVSAVVSVQFTPGTGCVNEYSGFQGSNPLDIVTGPDGNLWFTGLTDIYVGRSTPLGAITSYDFTGNTTYSRAIAPSPDGNLWITDYNYTVHTFTTAGTAIAYKDLCGQLEGVTAGPDGKMWLACTGGSIWKVAVDGSSATSFTTGLNTGASPARIRTGGDGNLWFVDTNKGVGMVTPSGTITEYTTASGSIPRDLALGADGAMWMTDFGRDAIARVSTAGAITEYALATGAHPFGIAKGSDGAMWFTEQGANKIGRIAMNGSITEFSSGLSPAAQLGYIASGPDSAMWFTEQSTNLIGRIQP